MDEAELLALIEERDRLKTMLVLLHHTAAEHCRVWHGAIPTSKRDLPLNHLLNAVDMAGEELGEARINKAKARQILRKDRRNAQRHMEREAARAELGR